MDKKLTIGLIAGACAVTVAAGVFAAVGIVSSTPENMLLAGIANTVSDAKANESYQVLHNMISGGSLEVGADLQKLAGSNTPGSADFKAYFDKDRVSDVIQGSVTLDQDTYTAQCFINPDSLVFDTDLIQDGAVGTDLRKVSDNIKGSILDPETKTRYSLDEEQYKTLITLRDKMLASNDLENEVLRIEKKYRKLFVDELDEVCKFTKDTDKISLNGKDQACYTVTIDTTAEEVAGVMVDVLEKFEDDKDLNKIIDRYLPEEEDANDFFWEIDHIIESLKNTDKADIKLVFYITRGTKRIAMIDGTVVHKDEDGTDSRFRFSLTLGASLKNPGNIVFTAAENENRISCEYKVEEDSKSAFSAVIRSLESDGESENNKTLVSFYLDRTNGDYTIKGDDLEISGTYVEKGSVHTITIDKIRGDSVARYQKDDSDCIEPALTIVISEKDKMPKAPSYREITAFTENELDSYSKDLSTAFDNLLEEIKLCFPSLTESDIGL